MIANSHGTRMLNKKLENVIAEIPGPDATSAPDALPEKPATEPKVTASPADNMPAQEMAPQSPVAGEQSGECTAGSDKSHEVPLSGAPSDSFQRLDPRFVMLERFNWWILTAIVVFVLVIGWGVSGIFFRGFDLIQWCMLLPILLIALGGWFSSRFFPAKTYESTSWQLKPAGLEIRQGIWWRHRVFIPRDRIQHTDVQQGPIMRTFGLATLVINTGGTHEPSHPLGGISLQVAEQLREQLTLKTTCDKPIATKDSGV